MSSEQQNPSVKKNPSFTFALLSLTIVIAILLVTTLVLGSELQLGMFFAFVAMIPITMYMGHSYHDSESFAFDAIRRILQLVMIILSVGAVVGAWTASGTIPTVIALGLDLITPQLFLVTALLLCSATSLFTGTSYGTIGSVGVALISVAHTLGISLPLSAAAVICGAYFGDKLSPLSDSTNLASAITRTPLLTHVRNLLWTTGPALFVTALIFTVIGLASASGNNDLSEISTTLDAIGASFHLGWPALLPLLVTIILLALRAPAFVAIFLGAFAGSLVAIFYQGVSADAAIASLYDGYTTHTGLESVDDLLSGGGVTAMYPTAGLFILAVAVAGLLNGSGVIGALVNPLMRWATSPKRLTIISYPIVLGGLMLGASYPFTAVMSGTLLLQPYLKKKLAPRTLARTIEDSGIIYDPVFPWTAGGIFCSATLGVPVLAYSPFLFFTYFSTLFSIAYALSGFTIKRLEDVPTEEYDMATAG